MVLGPALGTLYAVALWAAAFVPASLAGSRIASRIRALRESRSLTLSGLPIQCLFIALSMAVASYAPPHLDLLAMLTRVSPSAITASLESIAIAPLSAAASYVLTKTTSLPQRLDREAMPRMLEEMSRIGAVDAAILLILAPIGEEMLFRGLLEGEMLAFRAPLAVAIVVPATLFALIHLEPFRELKPQARAFIVANAFILGALTSYLMALTGSLIPSIVCHASANLGGIGYALLVKRSRSSRAVDRAD